MPSLTSILARVIGEQAVRLVLQATGLGAMTALLDAGKQVYDELQKRQFVTRDQLAALTAYSPEERRRLRDQAVAEAIKLAPDQWRGAEDAVRLVEVRFFEYLIRQAEERIIAQQNAVLSAKEAKLRAKLESDLTRHRLSRALGRVDGLVALRPDSHDYLRLQRRLESSTGGTSDRAAIRGSVGGALCGFLLGVSVAVNALIDNYGWPLRPEWGAVLGFGALVAVIGALIGASVAVYSDRRRVRRRDRALGDE